MMTLTVTLTDHGAQREALPVRAIPFVTGWSLSPDMIAGALSQTDEARRMRGVPSFRICKDSLTHVKAVDWEHMKVILDGLDDELPESRAGYAEWRSKSVRALPAGVFVWLDDFTAAFAKDFSPSNYLPDSRGEYPSINLDPMVPNDTVNLIFEQFEQRRTLDRSIAPHSDSELTVDYQSIPHGPNRDAAINSCSRRLRAGGNKAFIAETAKLFGVSHSAIKQAIARHNNKTLKPSLATTVGFASQLRAANKANNK